MELEKLATQMDGFVRRQGWYEPRSPKPQSPKNLAISLALEASEVLEHFQWTERGDKEELAAELADVVLYALQLGTVLEMDLGAAVQARLAANELRDWSGKRSGE